MERNSPNNSRPNFPNSQLVNHTNSLIVRAWKREIWTLVVNIKTSILFGGSNTGDPLPTQMHRDRAAQFKHRLNWAVDVDQNGEEWDEYDTLHAVYIIAHDLSLNHLGSLRLLRLSQPTMLFDHFFELVRGMEFDMAKTLECTRFCISPREDNSMNARIASALFVQLQQFSAATGTNKILAVFDPIMIRLYRQLGVSPRILSKTSSQNGTIFLGEWSASQVRPLQRPPENNCKTYSA